jgi:uncharacterized membrane protein YfcA
MSFLQHINPLYVASGFVVGFLVGITGVGGGSLMTPLLILLFGIHPVTAVGTDLLYATVTKTGGSLVHGSNRTIDWRVVGRLASGSLPASILTVLLLNYLNIDNAATNAAVSKLVGVVLLLASASLIFRKTLLAAYAHRVNSLSPQTTYWLTILTGAILGVLVSISSVGAGALGMTALILLYPELPIARLVGSDIAHAVPLTLVAGAGHWFLGTVDVALLGTLVIGSLPGVVLGSYLTPRLPNSALRLTLAAVLIAVSIKLLY